MSLWFKFSKNTEKHHLQVILVGVFRRYQSGEIQIGNISYKKGICAGS